MAEPRSESGPDDPAADVGRLPGVDRVLTHAQAVIELTYLDTARHDLARAGVTLWSEAGGDDAGWHARFGPASSADEVRSPAPGQGRPAERPPAELEALVRPWVLDRPLVPVLGAVVERRHLHLLDRRGILAEAYDDRVHVHATDDGGAPRDGAEPSAGVRREWVLRLVDGPAVFLDRARDALREAGWPEQGSSRGRLPLLLLDLPGAPRGLDPSSSAADVLGDQLGRLMARLRAADGALRRGSPEGVHDLRVALRRLRACLGTFGPVWEQSRTEALRRELRWATRSLGGARDLEVAEELLLRLVDDHPDLPTLVRDRAWLVASVQALRASLPENGEVLTSARYLTLLAGLEAFVEDPPWAASAENRASGVLPRLVQRRVARVGRALQKAEERPRGPARDEGLHEVRKRARRVRYAAEALEPAWGPAVHRLAEAATELSDVLGEQHDCAVAADLLDRLAPERDDRLADARTWRRVRVDLRERADDRERAARRLARRVDKCARRTHWDG